MTDLRRTPLTAWHKAHGGKMTSFAGWEMPLHYRQGILQEHLTVRRYGGLFDVSHMGRFRIHGPDAVFFLQRVLTNDVETLKPWQGQYTILANADGSALDDAYLFRLEKEYWLVVNAANREADWQRLSEQAQGYRVELEDITSQVAMIAVQGPRSESLLRGILEAGSLPPPRRNSVSTATLLGMEVTVSRTGYTGEPVGFEVFVPAELVEKLWEALADRGRELGMTPVGLGARDTLRLEAGLTLFGHELGSDPEGRPIPIFAAPSASIAVSFAERKKDYLGRKALELQAEAYRAYRAGQTSVSEVLPRVVRPLAVLDQGIARQGDVVYWQGQMVGWVTSGTMVPYWVFTGEDGEATPTDQTGRRALALAYISVGVPKDALVEVVVRGRTLRAQVVPRHGRSDIPPYFRPIVVQ